MTLAARLKQWMGRESSQEGGGGAGDAAGQREVRILVVCMGNICRSPIAEGVLRAKLAAAGLQQRVRVDSAGTHGYHTNEPPDPRAIRRAAQRGYAIGGLRARPVLPADFDHFDWMLAMDDSNLAWLKKRQPEGNTVQLGRLLDHARRHPGVTEVPDPYYGPEAGFDQVLDLVEDACDSVVDQVQAGTWRKA
jgi:protein-tyrosine phosphatase